MKIYIAGKITGDPDYRKKFNEAAERITDAGHVALNPAWQPDGLTQAEYMRIALTMLDIADAAVFLPGWEESEGAKVERAYCKRAGIPVTTLEAACGEPVGVPLTLDELKELVDRCEPVYVARQDGSPMFRGRRYCGAVLDRKITFGGPYDQNLLAIYGDKLTLWESDYGFSWVAYREKPEERE